MTWKEVKEKIEEGGVTDDMEMWFIDISFSDEIAVCPQEDDGPNDIGFSVSS